MNKTAEGFVQNFRVQAVKDGVGEKFFGENTRWYAIELAHRVETQGFTVQDIQKWDAESKSYVHDVSDEREKNGVVIPAKDSMDVLRERYGEKKVAHVDLDTSDAIGKMAAMAKTMATQSRRQGVESPLLHNFMTEVFGVARTLGVSSQDIVAYVTQAYPELGQPAAEPRQRRQHEETPA